MRMLVTPDCAQCHGKGTVLFEPDNPRCFNTIPCGTCMARRDAANPPPLVFTYRNHRGETGLRRCLPVRLWHGTTEWHTTPGWLLRGRDLERGEERDYAVADILAWGEIPGDAERCACMAWIRSAREMHHSRCPHGAAADVVRDETAAFRVQVAALTAERDAARDDAMFNSARYDEAAWWRDEFERRLWAAAIAAEEVSWRMQNVGHGCACGGETDPKEPCACGIYEADDAVDAVKRALVGEEPSDG